MAYTLDDDYDDNLQSLIILSRRIKAATSIRRQHTPLHFITVVPCPNLPGSKSSQVMAETCISYLTSADRF
jgi:hypothetical protein